MQLLYRGKTKDVYEDGAQTLRLVFTDRVTQNDAGEIDPGGNFVADLTEPGQGAACLAMASFIFSELHTHNIPTHMLAFDPAAASMTVRKANTFTPGLEWVGRWVCTGSFFRRYSMVPGVRDGMRLPSPVFEITLKDDAAGDPLIAPSAIVALGIVSARNMDILVEYNHKTMQALHGIFAARGLDLWDLKIEWGLDASGAPMLIDEISPGSCRAFKAGTRERVAGAALAAYFRK